ncbi:MAG: hypothetical protein DRN95_02220 [Candidatus Hydrothermarchaeota archaeon]|nr:MAG: hypothetical protein DRN95_02220 [Candidatus Hydrothermarchaeota archaeon]
MLAYTYMMDAANAVIESGNIYIGLANACDKIIEGAETIASAYGEAMKEIQDKKLIEDYDHDRTSLYTKERLIEQASRLKEIFLDMPNRIQKNTDDATPIGVVFTDILMTTHAPAIFADFIESSKDGPLMSTALMHYASIMALVYNTAKE